MDPLIPLPEVTAPGQPGRAAPRLDQPKPVDPQAAHRLKLRKATSEFEALFIAQLLKPLEKSLSQSSNGETLGGDVLFGVAITKMAEALAARGGVGLGDMMYRALESRVAGESAPEAGDDEKNSTDQGVIPLTSPEVEAKPLPDPRRVIPLESGFTLLKSDKR